MGQIAFVAGRISPENGLQPIFERVNHLYDGVRHFTSLPDEQHDLVITDSLDVLDKCGATPAIFILTASDGSPLLNISLQERRLLINVLRQAKVVVVFSSFAAKEIERLYRIKPIVQPPFVRQGQNEALPEWIIHRGVPESVRKAFPKHEFIPVSKASDFEHAYLYIDMNDTYECANIRMCLAAAHGVPSVAVQKPCNIEAASGGDLLLPPKSTDQRWIEAIKAALRDRMTNSDKNKKASKRFDNMSDLDREIAKLTKKKPGSVDLPRLAELIRRKRTQDRIESMNHARSIKNPKSQVKVGRTMGRRESIAERERRARRAMKKEEALNQTDAAPTFEVLDTPSWFTSTEPCDVSIIVPMYKSRLVIEKQIREWDLEDHGLKVEIIYVDDLCPKRSYEVIVGEWEKYRQHLKGRPVGKVIKSHANRGYGPNCNLGAKHALGKYLIFLNADVFVLPNWVKPMYDLMEGDPKIGIVGNLQIQSRSEQGLIDSAGSEWMWNGGHFAHIGRITYQNKVLQEPIRHDQMPADLSVASEREMVTGCCFMMPKSLFHEIGGYDEAYKIGYWEDSDMNMAVKEKGYKVYFEPNSKVLHVGGHTKAGGHQFMKQNRTRFFHRWVNTGFVDKIAKQKRPTDIAPPYIKGGLKGACPGKVTGCIIACNEEEFLEASVRSIAPMIDRFIFVIGGNHYAYQSGMCDQKGYPTDSTLEIAKSLAKEFNGVVIEPPGRIWQSKTEMRNTYAQMMRPNDWMFMLDGDEVYKPGQLWIISQLMQRYEVLRLQYYSFWNNVETLGIGNWDHFPQERIVKWREGYHYQAPNHLYLVDKDNKEIGFRVPTYQGAEKLFYHYSWVRPIEKIRQKWAYYKHQLAQEWKDHDIADNYVDNIFLRWRQEKDAVEFTHPRGGGSWCPFAGIHPHEVNQLIEQGKLNF